MAQEVREIHKRSLICKDNIREGTGSARIGQEKSYL